MFSTLPPALGSRPGERTSLLPAQVGPDAFVAEAALDAWSRRGQARRAGGTLWLVDAAGVTLPHDVVDAVRILGRRDGESDPYGWTGRVFSLRELLRLGATLAPDGCRLGSATYDVEIGVQVTSGPDLRPRDRAHR